MIRISLLFILLVTMAGCSDTSSKPTHAITDYQGAALPLISPDSQWLVVNYWATWCDPCREEIPELNALGQAANGVRVWGVDFDAPSSMEELAGKVEKMGITFPVVAPDKVNLMGLERPPVLPATYILDGQGVMKKRLLGPQTQESLDNAVQQLRNA